MSGKLLRIGAIAAVILLAGCERKEEPDLPPTPPGPVEVTFNITYQQLSLDGQSGTPQWPYSDTYNSFTKEAPYIVMAPKQEFASWDGTLVYFTFPSTQHARDGHVPVEAAIGIGTGTSTDITLEPVFGGIHLVLERDDVYAVTFRGNGDERIAGEVAYNPANGLLEMRQSVDEIKLETLTGVMDGSGEWFIGLPPIDFRGGFSLDIEALEGSYEYSYTEPVAIRKGEFTTMIIPNGLQTVPDILPIPDANFKAYLLSLCDANADGEISPAEAATVTSIETGTQEIRTLEGIRYFTNLETLTANGSRAADRTILGQLTELDLTGLDKLRSLQCKHNYITRLTLSGNTALTNIVCYGNSLEALDLSGAPMIESVDAGDCAIGNANVHENTFLRTLFIHNNKLTALDLEGNPQLTALRCDQNLITELNVSKCTSLSSLDCSPMNNASGQNVLTKLILSTGMTISQITENRSSSNIPDGTEIVYVDAPVKPTLGTGLRTMYITTPGGSGIYSKDYWTDGCTVQLVDDAGNVYYDNSNVSVKGRGNSTWNYPKKPYALKLPEKANLIGTGEDKRWVLLANWMDRTLLRNDVTFEIARLTSLEWTPSGEFIELYLNGKHQGNYWLGEKVKTGTARLKADYLIEMDVNYDEDWRYYSTYGRRVNQGANGLPINVKEPDADKMTDASFTALKNLVAGVENSLYNNTGDYRQLMNTNTFVDWYIVHELTYNGEPNHPKSCFFYFRDGIMYAGPVWDFDWYTFQPYTSGLFIPNSIYYSKLLADNDFKAALKARWTELKPKFQSVYTYIDQKADEIRASEAINWTMWPCTSSSVNGDERYSFQQSVDRMKTALANRILALDTAIANL